MKRLTQRSIPNDPNLATKPIDVALTVDPRLGEGRTPRPICIYTLFIHPVNAQWTTGEPFRAVDVAEEEEEEEEEAEAGAEEAEEVEEEANYGIIRALAL